LNLKLKLEKRLDSVSIVSADLTTADFGVLCYPFQMLSSLWVWSKVADDTHKKCFIVNIAKTFRHGPFSVQRSCRHLVGISWCHLSRMTPPHF